MSVKQDIEKFYTDYYGQLVGAKVVGFHLEDGEHWNEPWPVFTMQINDERVRFVLSRDEEGNGGGFAFIEEDKA